MRTGRPRRPLPERLAGKVMVDFESGCWLWLGLVNAAGYGIVHEGGLDGGRRLRAHRAVYELLVGPISAGLTLDHLCRVRHCVNPTHLEPVTIGENVLRGEGPAARNARKTHCLNGHPYTEENTVTRRGGRECRTCIRERSNERYRRENGGVVAPSPAERTHCPQGHEYDEANTYRRANGHRQCRACHREQVRAAKQRRGAEASTR